MSDREPYESAETPDVKPLDYVEFYALVEQHTNVFVKAATAKQKTSNKNVKLAVAKRGRGMVLALAKNRSKVVMPRDHKSLLDKGEMTARSVVTARVDTGPQMGVVTAVLNGAVCTGVQMSVYDQLGAAS